MPSPAKALQESTTPLKLFRRGEFKRTGEQFFSMKVKNEGTVMPQQFVALRA
jgi:hypothetical protein